jgi:D-beta-D-heptose 7-phosphate kinase/D-beta-D-heptose 1-phosphate adenosyltransferase
MIHEASQYGYVIVALNSDAWLTRKKGFVFMPFVERREVLLSLYRVNEVIEVDDSDGTIWPAIMEVKPDFFANGGDRIEPNQHEAEACRVVGCKQLWNVGGDKIQSSSWLINRRMA